MALLGKEQTSFCAVIPMNADVCMLNLCTVEFAAAGNQKSVETQAGVFLMYFSLFFITSGYIYAKIYIKPIYRQTAIG